MKKQVINLMMTLAIVFGLSVSAMAQTTAPDNGDQIEGSPGNPKVYLTGATGTLEITKGFSGSTVEWSLYKGSTAGSLAVEGTDLDVTDDSGTGGDNRSSWTPEQTDNGTDATSTFNFKWTDQAAGNYYAEVVETAPAANGGCVTTRGFHIFILGFDIEIYASSSDGTRYTGDQLTGCGDGTYPAFMNNVAIDGTSNIRTDILNTTDNPAPTDGSLANVHGIDPRTTRYYTARIVFDTPDADAGEGSFTPTAPESVTMDITIGGTNITALDVVSINNTDVDATTLSLTTTVNEVSEDALLYTFPVVFNDRWGIDLEPTAQVLNTVIHSGADGGGTNLGEEPSAYEDIDLSDEGTDPGYENNLSNSFTIYGKPETSTITGN